MTNRNVIVVALLSFITLGIYALVWSVVTKREMNQRGARIPTAWLLIVPLANIWWLWRYSQGTEFTTSGKLGAPVAFLLLWLLPGIGHAIIQDYFNRGVPAAQHSLAS